MFRMRNGFVLWTCFALSLSAWGRPQPPEETEKAYFTINDSLRDPRKQKILWEDPTALLIEGFESLASLPFLNQIYLLKWSRHDGLPPAPGEPYDRKKHFGSWLNDKYDDTCFSTRVKVLLRESSEPVGFKENSRCQIATGRWADPYSGSEFHHSTDLDIDHVVPLKNAFISGAWTWNYQKRCLYANYLANDFHLRAVAFYENRIKADMAPDRYLPPNEKFVCEYLQDWLKIKLIWELDMTASEARAVERTVDQYNCDRRTFRFSLRELAEQRQKTVDLQRICRASFSSPLDGGFATDGALLDQTP